MVALVIYWCWVRLWLWFGSRHWSATAPRPLPSLGRRTNEKNDHQRPTKTRPSVDDVGPKLFSDMPTSLFAIDGPQKILHHQQLSSLHHPTVSMVWNRIRDALAGPPTLDGPSVLPPYFPVEPRGCEHHAQKLFDCLATKATEKARDMEKAGYGKSYYPDVEAERLKNLKKEEEVGSEENNKNQKQEGVVVPSKNVMDVSSQLLPSPDDNPLDECRQFIAYYKRCCDRELKKKKNWILTEPYRVQEEYRYKK
jgi:hypothetical protein